MSKIDKKIPTKVKNKILINELFPEFTSDRDLELIDKWSRKKNEDGSTAESLIVLPNNREIMLPDDFDVRELMNSAEDPVTGTLRSLKVDDRDLAWAKNYYDYSYKIIGRDANPPWARQMWTGVMLFGEVCTACTKSKYLDIHNIPKGFDSEFMPEIMTLLEHGVCPKCKRHKWDLIKNHNLCDYQQLVNVLGQRSGKSSSAAGGYATYMTHQYLKFPDLGSLAKSDMQASTQLTGTFVSLSLSKAVGVLWTPYVKMIEASSWFKEYHRMLASYKQGRDTELHRSSSMYLAYFHKNLRFYPSGPRSTTLRGDTRIFGALDELGLFPLPKGDAEEDEQSERANADEAHKSMARSLTTVQGIRRRLMKEGISAVPGSVLLNVSSPIAQRDKMMRLLRQSRTPEGKTMILGVNLPTWEVNPGMDRDHPTIALAYLENAEMAERDYGANPPSVHSQFMPRKSFEGGVFVNGQNSHNFTPLYDVPGQIYGKVEKIRSVLWPSVITIDAGHTNNSFVITGEHYNFDTGKTVVSTVIEIMPQEGRTINFNLVYKNIILPVARDINAVAMLADQWQGIDLLYRIEEDMGMNPLGKVRCKAKQYSPRRRDFDTMLAMFQAGNVLAPTISEKDKQEVFDGNIADYRQAMINKPIPHLFLQLNTIQDLGVSRCPGKGDGYTDDIVRALVLGVSKIHEPKLMDRLKEARTFSYSGGGGRVGMPMPAFAGRSGGNGHRGLR